MHAPYLDKGVNIYGQMEAAYNCWGTIHLTFSIWTMTLQRHDNPYGTMTDEHFQALQKFWNQIVTKSTPNLVHAEAALVLPKDYGWGMRSPTDRIWGFWGPDDKSARNLEYHPDSSKPVRFAFGYYLR